MAEELGIRLEGLPTRTMGESGPAEINTVMRGCFNKGERVCSFGVQRAKLDAIHAVRSFRPLFGRRASCPGGHPYLRLGRELGSALFFRDFALGDRLADIGRDARPTRQNHARLKSIALAFLIR